MYMHKIGDNNTNPVPLNLTTVINATWMEDDPFIAPYDGRTIIEQNYSMIVYAILIALSVIITTLSRMIFYKLAMSSSTNLHDTMFVNILQATMRFFDTNPSGNYYRQQRN